VVECDLAKVEVAGSNPVSRSRISSPPAHLLRWTFSGRNANVLSGTELRSKRGAVPKW
jgi:hypothetical protein